MSTDTPEQQDPLAIVVGNPNRALQVLLWKIRHRYPDLAVTITAEEIAALDACTDYLEVTPEAKVSRPHIGQAGQPMTPAPYVVIAMVQAGTQNAVRAIENNQADRDRQIRAEQVRAIAAAARQKTAMLRNGLRAGTFSESEIDDALGEFATLAQAYLDA